MKQAYPIRPIAPTHLVALREAVAYWTEAYGGDQTFAIELAVDVGRWFDPAKLGPTSVFGYVKLKAAAVYDRRSDRESGRRRKTSGPLHPSRAGIPSREVVE